MFRTQAGLMGMFAGLMAGFLSVATPVAQAQGRDVIRCGSTDGRFARCGVPWRDAEIIRQESNSPCTRGDTWGMDRYGLWVDRGCRGQFVEMGRGGGWRDGGGWRGDDDRQDDRWQGGGGWRPGPDWDREIRLQCESNDRRYQFCMVDVGNRGRARLVRQLSGSACEEGYSWGWNRAGVWVSRGCRGLFSVDRRW